jgi:plasmid maintenance system antidote protein VapI
MKNSNKNSIVEFQLLNDFLKSGKTQKDFAKEINISVKSLASKLTKQLRTLEKTTIIKLDEYVENKHSILIIEVKSKRKMWLQAIEAYNVEIKKKELQKKLSEKYYFSFDEVTHISKWFDILKVHTPDLLEEADRQLYFKIQEINQL